MKHNANLDVKGVVVGSTASISSLNAVQYLGTGGVSTFGTLSLANSDMSYGMNGSTITATHTNNFQLATQSFWPGMHGAPFWGGMDDLGAGRGTGSVATAAGNTSSTFTFGYGGFPLLAQLEFNVVEAYAQPTLNNAATTASATEGCVWGLYTRTGFTFNLVSSFQWQIKLSKNNQSRTLSWFWGTNGAANNDGLTVTGSDEMVSYFGTLNAGIGEDFRRVVIYSNAVVQTLPPDMYYIAGAGTARANGVAGLGMNGNLMRGHYWWEVDFDQWRKWNAASNSSFNPMMQLPHSFTSTSQNSLGSFYAPDQFTVASASASGNAAIPVINFFRST